MTIEQATRTLVKATAFTGLFEDYTEDQLETMALRLEAALAVTEDADEVDPALERAALRVLERLHDFLGYDFEDVFEVDGEI
jgi:hypothetical protein